ncbi:TraK family protein [bacterium]|nr:TraK family protein [bacterium]
MSIMSEKRSRSFTPVSRASIEQAMQSLQSLLEKPKEELAANEAFLFMRDTVQAALSKGYSYEEISERLRQQGVELSGSSLRYYMARVRRSEKATGSGKTQKTRTPGKGKSALTEVEPLVPVSDSVEVAPIENSAIEAESPAEPTLAKTTRRKTAAAQAMGSDVEPSESISAGDTPKKAGAKTKTSGAATNTSSTKSRSTTKRKTPNGGKLISAESG